jgi:hypothetical protein
MILKDAVQKAYDKYFVGAETDADVMTAVMTYYKEHLHILKMSMGGFQSELNAITLRYRDVTDDANVLKWAGEIRRLFSKKKIIKSNNFDPIEYLAVTYIAGNRGTSNWVSIASN